MDLLAAADTWRRDGVVVLLGFLAGPDLEAAKAGLTSVYPTAAEYHADPSSERNGVYAGDEYGGLIPFPFPTVALCNLAVHDRVVDFVEAAFGTKDVRIYASELWAKYSGATTYEQEHHRDYLNHTPLAPSIDIRWRGLELFIWLSEVTEELGPTHLVPLSVTNGLPALPHLQQRSEQPALYQQEGSALGTRGHDGRLQHRHLSSGDRTYGAPVSRDSASMPATAMLKTLGPLATLGVTDHFTLIGHPLWNRRPCASYFSLGFLPQVIPTGPQRRSKVLQLATPVSI